MYTSIIEIEQNSCGSNSDQPRRGMKDKNYFTCALMEGDCTINKWSHKE